MEIDRLEQSEVVIAIKTGFLAQVEFRQNHGLMLRLQVQKFVYVLIHCYISISIIYTVVNPPLKLNSNRIYSSVCVRSELRHIKFLYLPESTQHLKVLNTCKYSTKATKLTTEA